MTAPARLAAGIRWRLFEDGVAVYVPAACATFLMPSACAQVLEQLSCFEGSAKPGGPGSETERLADSECGLRDLERLGILERLG